MSVGVGVRRSFGPFAPSFIRKTTNDRPTNHPPIHQIRFHAALILERLRACPATLPALAALNPLLLDAHRRVLGEMKG